MHSVDILSIPLAKYVVACMAFLVEALNVDTLESVDQDTLFCPDAPV